MGGERGKTEVRRGEGERGEGGEEDEAMDEKTTKRRKKKGRLEKRMELTCNIKSVTANTHSVHMYVFLVAMST